MERPRIQDARERISNCYVGADLRGSDAACFPKSKLRDDDSLFLYQAKVKGKSSAPVYGLLPPEVADELRNVPPNIETHPEYFFWSGRSKRKK